MIISRQKVFQTEDHKMSDTITGFANFIDEWSHGDFCLQILESFWNIWSQVSQRKKPFSDFPARGRGVYTLSWGIHEVAVAVRWPEKLKSMMAVIE